MTGKIGTAKDTKHNIWYIILTIVTKKPQEGNIETPNLESGCPGFESLMAHQSEGDFYMKSPSPRFKVIIMTGRTLATSTGSLFTWKCFSPVSSVSF